METPDTPIIIKDSSFDQRKDYRSEIHFQNDLNKGIKEQELFKSLVESTGRKVISLPINSVDANPDLTICNPETGIIWMAEIQMSERLWNSRDAYTEKLGITNKFGFHVKAGKMNNINNLLRQGHRVFLIQIIIDRKEIIVLNMNHWQGYGPVDAPPLGFKPCYFFPSDEAREKCVKNKLTEQLNALYRK
jgi:hypothetical protein